MAEKTASVIPSLIAKHQKQLLDEWLSLQRGLTGENLERSEVADQSGRFLIELRKSGAADVQTDDIQAESWASMRELLEEVSRLRAQKGFTPSQTATFVFSLKEPLFNLLYRELAAEPRQLAKETWLMTVLLDKLGLYTTEVHQRNREQIIIRQQQELLELSTPVVQLWDGILALPLIGTLDSARTQVVMENLLQEIVATGAEIAIIDITGVPTVDTLVAQHLLKTISAARLMGADCIISGIRPQIAQTIVHLGVDLSVTSKATMADALELALRRTGRFVATRAKPTHTTE
jgi:rsbT co-antagonist protein RsbR